MLDGQNIRPLYSNLFEKYGNIEAGVYLSISIVSLTLNDWAIFAIFIFSEKIPWHGDSLKICLGWLIGSLKHFLKTLNPVLLFTFKEGKPSLTSFAESRFSLIGESVFLMQLSKD